MAFLERYEIDASQGERALAGLNRAYAKIGTTADDNSRRLTRQEKAARRLTELANPQQRYNRQMQDLARHVKAGRVNMNDAREVAQRYQQRLERVEGAGQRAFDPSVLVRWGAAFATPTAAIQKTLEVLRKVREEQRELAQAQRTESEAAAALVTLAGGDRVKRDQLFAAADRTFAEGYVRNRTAAYDLTFEAESSGTLGDRRFQSRLSVLDDAAELTRSAGLIRSGFAGGDDVGGSQAIISKAIAAALPATGVTPSSIAEGVAEAAAPAKSFGITDEELFAAVSRVAQRTGSGTKAGQQVRGLLTTLARQGLADQLSGQGLDAIIQNIESRDFSGEELVKFLGNDQAIAAFDTLRDRPALARRIEEVALAQAENLAQQTIENALDSDRVSAPIAVRRAKARGALGRDDQATRFNQGDALQGFRANAQRDRGLSEFAIAADRMLDSATRFLIGDERFIERKRDAAASGNAVFRDDAAAVAALNALVTESKQQTEAIRDQSAKIPTD